MVDVSRVTPEQDYIIARHSRMVGKILDLIEAFTPEGTQLEKQKKLIQIPLYDFRKEMIFLDSNGVPDPSENV
tara:strand:+ start:205 stop:423 length:219 start_codon:yes stop_codon:yes gene_type:complete